jgi:glycopeptide antibiotics resistance protein
MKKFLIILSIIYAVVANAFFGYTLANAEGVISQSGDLCGGTGGNGQIVSVGDNSFTLKLNEGNQNGGGNLIVNLTSRTMIETPTGYASLPDLKIGDRVTLVGDAHRDGTFTADAVVLCSGTQQIGTQENGTGQTNHITVRNENSEKYEKVSGIVNTATILLVGLIWLAIAAFILLKKKKGLVHVLFFTIFYIYLYKVLDYTFLQFQSLLLLQHFVPNLMLRGVEAGRSLNLIPLATLGVEDVKTSLLNILMMLPFGFGLPFITNFRMRKVVIAGLLLSIAIEFLQFITGFMANTTFRVADINDLIFNTAGVAIGYMLFVAFVRVYRRIFHDWKIRANPILRYIAGRSQVD